MRRPCGFVANVRFEANGANQRKPASDQIVIKVWWLDEECREYRHVFARSTSYASGFAPRLISPLSSDRLSIGDIVSGMVEAPRPQQLSTNFVAWDMQGANLLKLIR